MKQLTEVSNWTEDKTCPGLPEKVAVTVLDVLAVVEWFGAPVTCVRVVERDTTGHSVEGLPSNTHSHVHVQTRRAHTLVHTCAHTHVHVRVQRG